MSGEMLTLYWLPRTPGASNPRLRAWEGEGRRVFSGVPVIGGLMFTIPDNPQNKSKFHHVFSAKPGTYDWTTEYNEPGVKKPKEAPTKPKAKDEKPKKKATGHPVERVNKYEVMDILTKANIKFGIKEKAETLFEKVPDDLKRNLKLAKSES